MPEIARESDPAARAERRESDPETEEIALESYILGHLDAALQEGHIKVYYQPVIRTVSRQLCGLEALARWDDPVWGLLPPDRFVGILEKHRRIHDLDSFMVREVCARYRKTIASHTTPLPVSINLSRLDYELCDIFDIVETAAQTNKVPRQSLCIEITESVLNEQASLMRYYIERFRGAGYQVWMDDFGSGYSSLNVLKDYQFDELKIDMAFLSDFHARSKEILSSIVHMAKEINIQTLVEGVETEEQFEFLRNIGCEKVQGFLFGKPMPYWECIRHVAEKGVAVEPPVYRKYYDDLGRLNVLSATPFVSAVDKKNAANGRDRNRIPLAVLELRGGKVRLLFSNDAFDETAAALSWHTILGAPPEYLLMHDTIPLKNLSGQFGCLLEEARTSGSGKMYFVDKDEYYEIRLKRIAAYSKTSSILISLINLSRDAEIARLDALDDGLRQIYGMYDQVFLLDLKKNTASAFHMHSKEGQGMERQAESENLSKAENPWKAKNLLKLESLLKSENPLKPENLSKARNLSKSKNLRKPKKRLKVKELLDPKELLKLENLMRLERLSRAGNPLKMETLSKADNLSDPETLSKPENLREALDRYARDFIFPDDRRRYLAFTDPVTLEKRLFRSGHGYISAYLRTRLPDGEYVWKFYLILRVRERLYFLMIRDTGEEIRGFLSSLDAGNSVNMPVRAADFNAESASVSAALDPKAAFSAAETDFNPNVNPNMNPQAASSAAGTDFHPDLSFSPASSQTAENPLSPALLWENFQRSGPLKLFWKDRERRFQGVSQSFLDFYGFHAQDEITGRTDEEMGWHIHPDLYRIGEYDVIHKGVSIYDVLGSCIARGEIRNIIASKTPIYDGNGEIQGLLGYFSEVDAPEDWQERAGRARHDTLTGLLSARGVEEALYAYQDEYDLRRQDYARIHISIADMSDVNRQYGYDFGDRLICAVADALLDCCGNAVSVGRVQGAQFVALYQFERREELDTLTRRIREIPAHIQSVGGVSFRPYLLIGVSVFSESESARAQANQAQIRMMTDDSEKDFLRSSQENIAHFFHPFDYIPLPYAVYKLHFETAGEKAADRATDATILYVNHAFCRMAGRDRQELTGRKISELFSAVGEDWLQIASRAAVQGEIARDLLYSRLLDALYDVTASQVIDSGYCAFTYQKTPAQA